VNNRLTSDELEALPPKAKRDPDVVRLYREHDYLTAYGLHTDRRVATEGYATAIGADASRDNWDSHGDLQRDFLLKRGLHSSHLLLEIGCGAGRLARKITPVLDVGNYHGSDISLEALAAAQKLANQEGWSSRCPTFWFKQMPSLTFEFVWAHSVITHLSPEMIAALMSEVRRRLTSTGVFYWTYVPADETVRYGLTQFRTSLDDLHRCAQQAGLTFEDVPDWVESAGYTPGRWSYEQRMALSQHAT
jgi:SAM-dependent methyltransferase